MKDNDISRFKLIDAAGISMTTLESMAAGNNVSKETALGISEALEVQPEELFDIIGTDRKFSTKTLLHYAAYAGCAAQGCVKEAGAYFSLNDQRHLRAFPALG